MIDDDAISIWLVVSECMRWSIDTLGDCPSEEDIQKRFKMFIGLTFRHLGWEFVEAPKPAETGDVVQFPNRIPNEDD